MIYGERTHRSAFCIGTNGSVAPLTRTPFMSGNFNEAWLQELLEDNPAVIPAADVSLEYRDLVCIGREVPVGSGETQGYIDNLYVTPSGGVVIVETKLYRNQEARRTVVAQIIDYAKELQKWDAAKLDEIAYHYTYRKCGQAHRIIDLMTAKGLLSFSDEKSLTDSLNVNLENASFLLLIIGDGIRTGVQQLADFLNDNTSMSFRLALAEIEVYERGDETIVVPYLLTKTSIVERRAVPFTPVVEEPRKWKYVSGPILSRGEFINRFAENGGYNPDEITDLIYTLETAPGLSVKIMPTELTIQLATPDGRSFALLTFGISGGHADLYIMPGRIKAALERAGVFSFEAEPFLEAYKPFVDLRRCKTPPYEYAAGFYYADIDKVLSREVAFVSAAEQFALSVAKSDAEVH